MSEKTPSPEGGRASEDAQAPEAAGSRFTRREILRVAATGAAVATTVGGGIALYDRDPGRPVRLQRMRDHRVAAVGGVAAMSIARGGSPAENARKVVEALGGMEAFVRPGEKVVIKPNVGWNRTEEQAANTNPALVAQLVRMARAAGASEVWVTDVPVNSPEQCFDASGIRQAVGAAGGTVVLPGSNDFREAIVGNGFLRTAEVLWPFLAADKVINVPIAKHHRLSGATLSMKNWYGAVGGQRARLHQDIHHAIVELALMMKPTLTVLDATRVLLTNGPSGGRLEDVKRLDTVAASMDEVALDAFGASLLGIDAGTLEFIALAEAAGLGTARDESRKVVAISD